MKDYALAEVYRLLEPGPVALVTTAVDGRANVMTMAWQTMLEFVPPLVATVIAESNHSFAALAQTRECVLALPTADLAKQVVDIGNCSGRDVDKFAKFGLTRLPAAHVAAPLVGECFANLECRVADDALVDRYNLFILEVVKAWVDPRRVGPHKPLPRTLHHHGEGLFHIPGETLNLRRRMVKWVDQE